MSRRQTPLAILKRLSEASLQLFDSQPTLASRVEAWARQKVNCNDAGELCDRAGIAKLISNQQVVQLLAAALTTLLKGLAAARAGTTLNGLSNNQVMAFAAVGDALSLILQACNKIWVEDRSSNDKQELQKVAQQVAESGA
jgi:hypothetical protein